MKKPKESIWTYNENGTVKTRRCCTCHAHKTRFDFAIRAHAKHGFNYQCRECVAKECRERRARYKAQGAQL